jgi:hypothetical protein
MLYVTAQLRKTATPAPAVLKAIRDNAMQAILTPESRGRSS